MEEEEGLVEIKIENVEVKVETEAKDNKIDKTSHKDNNEPFIKTEFNDEKQNFNIPETLQSSEYDLYADDPGVKEEFEDDEPNFENPGKLEPLEAALDVDDPGVKEEMEDDQYLDPAYESIPSQLFTKSFNCKYCSISFSIKTKLKHHMQTVHEGILMYKFKCDQCDYNATQKISLDRHKRSVHGGLTFTCILCLKDGVQKNFKWEVDLKRHIEARHSTQKFKCDQCEHEFNTKRYLNNHKKLVHLGKAFSCDQCDVKLTSRTSLQMHVEAVHLQTKYQCESCEFQASWRNDLNRHVKEVHMRTRFQCGLCSYATPRNYLLSKHMQAKHAAKSSTRQYIRRVLPKTGTLLPQPQHDSMSTPDQVTTSNTDLDTHGHGVKS